MTITSVINKVKILLNSDIIKNNVEITEDIPENYYYINLQNGYIPFLLSKLILELINVGNKNLKITTHELNNKKIILELNFESILTPEIEHEIISLINITNEITLTSNNNCYLIELNKVS